MPASALPEVDGSAVKVPGRLQVAASEVTPQGLKNPIGNWDVPPERLRPTWRNGVFTTGYFVTLPWQTFPTTERDRLIREVVLLLKTGHLDVGYFRQKYGRDIRDEFRAAFDKLRGDGWLTVTGESIDCTPAGLMQIDRHLPAFFDPQYISSRYT